jgi:hypothetical protein
VHPFVLALLATQLLSAQREPGVTSGADSAAVVRTARNAQKQFERTRRVNLPWDFGSSGVCEEHIGRFCYWHDTGHDDHPKEPPVIARARDRLTAILDSAAQRVSGDVWITNQRVRYLSESGRHAEALIAAQACRGEAWWCSALGGYALHAGRDFARADSAFAVALQAMPNNERCRWTDLGVLLDGRAQSQYSRVKCEERDALAARWWWVADPLFMIPGNERRTEHYARQVVSRLERETRSVYDMAWGDDLHELGVRYGWPNAWSRARRSGLSDGMAGASIVGHEPAPGFHFFPAVAMPDDTLLREPERWSVSDPRPRERYAPTYAKVFVSIGKYQIARFKRGDSMLVVGAFDVRDDSLFGNVRVEAALGLGRDVATPLVVRRRERSGPVETLVATAPWSPSVVSLEIMAPERRHAARLRFAADGELPRDRELALSDILLFDPREPLSNTLGSVLLDVTPTTNVERSRKVGLYWEVYGLATGTPVTTSLTIARGRTRWLRRLGERVRLAPKSSPVSLHWQETPVSSGGVAGRSLAVDVATLSTGSYTIELTIRVPNREPIQAVREIEVVP